MGQTFFGRSLRRHYSSRYHSFLPVSANRSPRSRLSPRNPNPSYHLRRSNRNPRSHLHRPIHSTTCPLNRRPQNRRFRLGPTHSESCRRNGGLPKRRIRGHGRTRSETWPLRREKQRRSHGLNRSKEKSELKVLPRKLPRQNERAGPHASVARSATPFTTATSSLTAPITSCRSSMTMNHHR